MTAEIVKQGTGIGGKPYIPAAERKMILTLLGYSVGYNISDKMLGLVLYSHYLYLNQCKLHLEDRTGTYKCISKLKNQILVSVVDRLKYLLAACNIPKMGFSFSGKRQAMQVLCNLEAANALGARSRPIASNIGYPTGQVSHFLDCQLRDAVLSHEFVLKGLN